ncbi:MAG: VOC family protein [Proteobacteria bacterium]|nr:VOC family protein [Pseudomonadota bacterium]MDA1059837.1 VOC family protein [Pseudomonadota bacterium]
MSKIGALRIDHAAMAVHDPLVALDFYGDVLGLPLVDTVTGDNWGGYEWLMMTFALGAGRQLALCAFRGVDIVTQVVNAPTDVRHLSLSVASAADLTDYAHRLQAAGRKFELVERGPQTLLYFHDPSGNLLEIAAPSSAAAAIPARGARAADVMKWAQA